MWLVRVALRRPYTFVVMAMLIALGGVLSVRKAPTDIFPAIEIPVVSVIWNYGGLPPEDMEKRIVNNFERFLTTIVADIDHVDSQSLTGIAVIKIYLQPGADVDQAIAQTTAIAQTAVRSMPPGTVPPLIMRYSATSVPIMQIALDTDTLSEKELFDYGINFIRADIATVPGAQIPYPYGGKQRTIMVDIDLDRLHGWGLSPRDVSVALGLQDVVLPSGTAKLGVNEYPVVISATPETLGQLGDMPLKTVNGHTVYIKDVANVRDGNSPQTNMVHVEGRRSVLMTILKNGNASTLAVNDEIRRRLPAAIDRLPAEARGHLTAKPMFDQSVFVRASIAGVVREAVIAAILTAIMILIFLGSWRSTLIVVISIPLAILFALIAMTALGETLNVMTLGGLALAVGILVDDATVEIENIHRNLGYGKPIITAILDGAQQIAMPALVSTLCICIVFAPIYFLTGASRYLFVPMAMAVVFAMLMSYILSRTLVPTMVHYLLAGEAAHGHAPNRFSAAFERGFERFRASYGRGLAWCLQHRGFVVLSFALLLVVSAGTFGLVGRDFFPTVDAGLIKLHVRLAPGTRIEEAEKQVAAIERTIRTVIPPDEIDTLLDVQGTPYSGINLSLSEGALVSPADAQVSISLKEGHAPTADYMRAMRVVLRKQYPEVTFFFLAPDISTQVLNFGLAAPIDLQVVGPIGSEDKTLAFARQLSDRVSAIPGAADVHLAQVTGVPELKIDVDRAEAQQAGVTEHDVASDLLVSLSSSGQAAPVFWVDKRGVQYLVSVQTPQYDIDSLDALRRTPISTPTGTQTLGNLATVSRTTGPANVTHSNVARTYDVQANVDGTDLGSVASAVNDVLADMRPHAPPGVSIKLKGQAESMEAFGGLQSGLLFSIVLVYLLMVVNFQSWLDPFIILMALPGAIAGIVWILFLTGTTLSVPALIGSIMCVGVATANSILVVSFANEQRAHGKDALQAALAAGMTRLRPVLMTALAMIIGMVPMAIGLGDGGEQNAPLGRAVIGGLVLATMTTLVFVPVMYSLLRGKPPAAGTELPRMTTPLSPTPAPALTPHQPRDPHDPDELGFTLPAPAKTSRITVIVVLVLAVGGLFAYGERKHLSAKASVPPAALVNGEVHPTRVQVFTAKATSTDQAIELPAIVKPLEQATIYPRASGYVKAWHADIGDKVAAGFVLADIDIPDLDAQLGQAQAQLAAARAATKQAQAQSVYSKSNATRYQGLGDQKLVAMQQVEQTVAQAKSDEATVAADQANASAAEANVHKLADQVSFSKVTAPFAGTVTSRTIDRGALVTEGNATPMFTIVATDPVRVFVDVPQNVAPSIKTGAEVIVTAREYPGRQFKGAIARAAGAFDPDLHTMSTEVRVPNGDGALVPGMYVRAALSLPIPHSVFEIPASALYSDAQGTRVATVDAAHKVHYVKIGIERDTGATLQVATGLDGTEKILRVAVASLMEGDPVEIAEDPAQKK